MFFSCIGDDVIFDTVPEQVRITNPIDTLGIGDTHTFQAQFLNNVGVLTDVAIRWSSTATDIVSIHAETGEATGLALGATQITATVTNNNGESISNTLALVTGENTSEIALPTERTGALQTTSTYLLEGDFVLQTTESGLTLSFAENYRASTSLPGLYLYLTNNPNSTNTAFEIGKATSFSGAHSYAIPASIDLMDYSHVLFFCKPFRVKVGDGAFQE